MFTDIDENLPAEDINAINYVSATGIMDGYSDGRFRPDVFVPYSVFCRSVFYAFNPVLYVKSTKLSSNKPVKQFWYSEYIDFVSNLTGETHHPKKTISISAAVQIISKFYHAILRQNSNQIQCEPSFSNNDHKSKLTRIILAKIFYCYTKQFITTLTIHNIDPEILFSFWERTQTCINPFQFALRSIECAPNLYPQNANPSFISCFPYLKALSIDAARETHRNMCDIDKTISYEFSSMHLTTIYQYTSLASLYAMLTQSNRAPFGLAPKIMLRMSNIAYLNDPDEGRFYQDSLADLLPENFSSDDSIIHTDDIYIVCFTKTDSEFLPMWVQYANQAQGCRIEFNGSDIKVTELQYVKDTELPKVMNKLIEIIKDSSSNTALKTYATDKLHEIQYYYKSANYQHEKEVRYTTTMPVKQALVDEGSSDNGTKIPRLYCNIPIPLEIKSVTLGPKCPDPERIALYLKHCGIENVYRSKIHFR